MMVRGLGFHRQLRADAGRVGKLGEPLSHGRLLVPECHTSQVNIAVSPRVWTSANVELWREYYDVQFYFFRNFLFFWDLLFLVAWRNFHTFQDKAITSGVHTTPTWSNPVSAMITEGVITLLLRDKQLECDLKLLVGSSGLWQVITSDNKCFIYIILMCVDTELETCSK